MLGKLLTTHGGHKIIIGVAAIVGIVLVITVDSCRTGTVVFLSVTALESSVFSLVYGFRSTWHREPAARAVFWAVFAYAALSTHLLIGFLFPYRFSWWDDVRELAYLGLAIAGLNLVLTLARVLGRRAFLRERRDDSIA